MLLSLDSMFNHYSMLVGPIFITFTAPRYIKAA